MQKSQAFSELQAVNSFGDRLITEIDSSVSYENVKMCIRNSYDNKVSWKHRTPSYTW